MKPTPAELWDRIDTWLAAHAPRIAGELRPGATAAEVSAAAEQLGVELPSALRETFLQHNGALGNDLFPALEAREMANSLHSLEEMTGFRLWDEPSEDQYVFSEDGIQPKFGLPQWIPFAGNGGGDYHCVDLAPAEGGTVGQVIQWTHDTCERRLVAASVDDYLRDLADGLEAGRFAYDEDD